MPSSPRRRDLKELLLLGLVLAGYLAWLIPTGKWPWAGASWFRLLVPNLWFLGAGMALLREWPVGFRLAQGGRHAPYLAALVAGVIALLSSVTAFWPGGTVSGTVDHVAQHIVLITMVPMAEELYFRGLLLDHLRRTSGGPLAVIIVSLIFGVLHLPQGSTLALSMAGLSLVLSLATLFSGSLLWSVALHSGWNATATVRTLAEPAARWVVAGVAIALLVSLAVRGVLTRSPGGGGGDDD